MATFHPPNLSPDGSVQVKGWMPELDGLRSFALLFVILTHWFSFFVDWDSFFALPLFFIHYGWIGVDLFFVLSGFLITGILLDSKTKAHFFLNFYIRRALRILPLYYLVLVLFMVVLPLTGIFASVDNFWKSPPAPMWYFLFISNLAEGLGLARHDFFVVTWSLAIEEHFYLFWPLVVFQYTRPTLKRICIGIVFFSFFTRVFLVHGFGGNLTLIGFLTPCRLEGLALGGLVAIIVREGKSSVDRLVKWCRFYLPIGFLAVIVFNVLQELEFSLKIFDNNQNPYVVSYGFFFIDLFFAALMVVVLFSGGKGVLSKTFRWSPLVWFGKFTYCAYLLHLPVHYFVRLGYDQLFGRTRSVWTYWLPLNIVSFVILVGVCWISWVCFEGPILRLKRHFVSKATDTTSENGKTDDVLSEEEASKSIFLA
jgi:peptidoglycan/LPS O-acetylase OafA/YrhL